MSKYAILATHDHTGHSAWLATRSANGPWTRDASSRLELDWQDVPASMNVAWENLMRRAEQDHEFDVHSHSVKIVEVQS